MGGREGQGAQAETGPQVAGPQPPRPARESSSCRISGRRPALYHAGMPASSGRPADGRKGQEVGWGGVRGRVRAQGPVIRGRVRGQGSGATGGHFPGTTAILGAQIKWSPGSALSYLGHLVLPRAGAFQAHGCDLPALQHAEIGCIEGGASGEWPADIFRGRTGT